MQMGIIIAVECVGRGHVHGRLCSRGIEININEDDQLGFGRPGGQKSNRSSASDVQGPSSLTSGCSGTALIALRMRVGRLWSVR